MCIFLFNILYYFISAIFQLPTIIFNRFSLHNTVTTQAPKKMTILSSSVLWNPYDFLSSMEHTNFQWIMTIVQLQPTVVLTQSHHILLKYLKYCLWVIWNSFMMHLWCVCPFWNLAAPIPIHFHWMQEKCRKTFLKTGLHYLGRKKVDWNFSKSG